MALVAFPTKSTLHDDIWYLVCGYLDLQARYALLLTSRRISKIAMYRVNITFCFYDTGLLHDQLHRRFQSFMRHYHLRGQRAVLHINVTGSIGLDVRMCARQYGTYLRSVIRRLSYGGDIRSVTITAEWHTAHATAEILSSMFPRTRHITTTSSAYMPIYRQYASVTEGLRSLRSLRITVLPGIDQHPLVTFGIAVVRSLSILPVVTITTTQGEDYYAKVSPGNDALLIRAPSLARTICIAELVLEAAPQLGRYLELWFSSYTHFDMLSAWPIHQPVFFCTPHLSVCDCILLDGSRVVASPKLEFNEDAQLNQPVFNKTIRHVFKDPSTPIEIGLFLDTLHLLTHLAIRFELWPTGQTFSFPVLQSILFAVDHQLNKIPSSIHSPHLACVGISSTPVAGCPGELPDAWSFLTTLIPATIWGKKIRIFALEGVRLGGLGDCPCTVVELPGIKFGEWDVWLDKVHSS